MNLHYLPSVLDKPIKPKDRAEVVRAARELLEQLDATKAELHAANREIRNLQTKLLEGERSHRDRDSITVSLEKRIAHLEGYIQRVHDEQTGAPTVQHTDEAPMMALREDMNHRMNVYRHREDR